MGAKVQMVPYRAGSGKKDNTKQWQCNLHQLLATLLHYKCNYIQVNYSNAKLAMQTRFETRQRIQVPI